MTQETGKQKQQQREEHQKAVCPFCLFPSKSSYLFIYLFIYFFLSNNQVSL
jgi:hypothetical protein